MCFERAVHSKVYSIFRLLKSYSFEKRLGVQTILNLNDVVYLHFFKCYPVVLFCNLCGIYHQETSLFFILSSKVLLDVPLSRIQMIQYFNELLNNYPFFLMIKIALISGNAGPCNGTQPVFRCSTEGSECIPLAALCTGIPDCPLAEDESVKQCGMFFSFNIWVYDRK